MKRYFLYLSVILLGAVLTGCSDDFDTPPMVVPTASRTPNMTIAEFKAKYWQDQVNYIDTVKEDIVIHGYVTSSDESGNIYKSLYIQDETGSLAISINGNSLNKDYRIGQEIVLPMQGYFVGKYNGQQQLGYPQYYERGGVWEATFLPLASWKALAQINGLPDPANIDTTTIKISDLGTDAATLQKYEGMLVRIDNVKFEAADGAATFANSDATTNRNIVDAQGNTLVCRNSNYASFRSNVMPVGEGSVVGILSYYNTRNGSAGTWQLYLRDINDVVGFNTSTKGLETDPWTVDEAIAQENTGASGWVKGYVVGAVAPEVTNVRSNSDIEWKAPTTLDNTLVIAPSADCTDYTKCLVVSLPQGTPFRQQANLKDWPEVYKTQISVKGTLATYMGTFGITGNSGARDEFKLSVVTGGVTSLDEGFEGGIPDDWGNVVVSGDKKWYTTTFNNNTYAAMTGFKGTRPPFDNWLVSPAVDIKGAANRTLTFRTQVNGYGSTTSNIEVYVLNNADPSQATVKEKLNAKWATAPASGYSSWVESGNIDLSRWADGTYFIAFRYHATSDANYATWCVDDVKFNAGGSSNPSGVSRADLETLNNGNATATFGTYTSSNGWRATNASVLKGAEADGNPAFKFIGFKTGSTTDYAYAANLNGKTSAVGTLVSPELTGGVGTLTFNYGYAYTESNGVSFRVDIKQNGSTVKTFTVTNKAATKYTAYTVNEAVNVTGNFTIEFTNLSPSKSTSNKDRVAIWNISWTKPGASARKHWARRR